jgi:hypothetical protein
MDINPHPGSENLVSVFWYKKIPKFFGADPDLNGDLYPTGIRKKHSIPDP